MNMNMNVNRPRHPWLGRFRSGSLVEHTFRPDNPACHGLCFSRFAPRTNHASLGLQVKRMLEGRSYAALRKLNRGTIK